MTDREKAEELRAMLRELLAPVVAHLEKSRLDGFMLSFDIGGEPFAVRKIDVSKRL